MVSLSGVEEGLPARLQSFTRKDLQSAAPSEAGSRGRRSQLPNGVSPRPSVASQARRLTERVRSEGAGRRLLLFGLQVGQAGGRGVRRRARRRRRLGEQGLGQLALLLLDLLLQAGDCPRGLAAARPSGAAMSGPPAPPRPRGPRAGAGSVTGETQRQQSGRPSAPGGRGRVQGP